MIATWLSYPAAWLALSALAVLALFVLAALEKRRDRRAAREHTRDDGPLAPVVQIHRRNGNRAA